VARAGQRNQRNSPGLLLRREFVVKNGVRRALLNVSGLGNYTLFVNGSIH
jgi:hypothetical protein